MTNPRFLELAKRLRNDSLPEKRNPVPSPVQPVNIPLNTSGNVSESFVFSYDGAHRDFFQELIRKNNELFGGTRAEIPVGTSGEVENMYSLKRFGLITSIYRNNQLRGYNLFPITPEQSEQLLKDGKLPDPSRYWEDLGLVLYDRSKDGENPQEVLALYKSLSSNKKELGLSKKDLEQKLVIIHPGLEKDSSMPHGVKPIILPGITRVYTHEVLSKVGEDPNFEGYGLNGGLPLINQLGSGNRTLYLPDETKDIGLRVLIRGGDRGLDARCWDLVYSGADGRVNFAPQGATKI